MIFLIERVWCDPLESGMRSSVTQLMKRPRSASSKKPGFCAATKRGLSDTARLRRHVPRMRYKALEELT